MQELTYNISLPICQTPSETRTLYRLHLLLYQKDLLRRANHPQTSKLIKAYCTNKVDN